MSDLKIVRVSTERDLGGCQFDPCDRNAYPYGIAGGDGYVVSCSDHAPQLCAALLPNDQCLCCRGKGWAVFTPDSGVDEVQRCDDCKVFETDEDATANALAFLTDAVRRSPPGPFKPSTERE